ncbi:MAG: OmpA family protein [Clostridium sp.]|nr:OmpA family protein [Prevotella sp.]MCM1428393.1 OmpA family protein [Clostridium sp.]MCM1474865.1 OmpA family protein [Muribaculaceae bacterium]
MRTGKFGHAMIAFGLCALLIVPMGCSSIKKTWNGMTQAGQGATAGGLAGATIGTGIGALIGGGKGTWIGALVGSALGAGTGALVGNAMDRQRNALQQQLDSVRGLAEMGAEAYRLETVKDSNNLDAIKLVLGNSVLFQTNSYTLSPEADATLEKVAYNLSQFPQTDVTVVGYTDNTGTEEINNKLSLERAQSVVDYLEQHGVADSRLRAIGDGWNNPVASNATAAGRAQNRRVEIYITADKQMIQNAQASNR